MPTIAETYDALRHRMQAVLDCHPGENMHQKCFALQVPIHAATVQRFLFGMPMRTETLVKLEKWIEEHEHAHSAHPAT